MHPQDDEGFTPFETALRCQNFEAVQCFGQYEPNLANLSVFTPKKPVLLAALQRGHHGIAQHLLKLTITHRQADPLLADALFSLPEATAQEAQSFGDVLRTNPDTPFDQAISAYSQKYRDLNPWFLSTASKIASDQYPTLQATIYTILHECLTLLAGTEDPLIRNRTQFKIIILFFSLNESMRTDFLIKHPLTPDLIQALDFTIAHGVVKPFCYASLDDDTHYNLIQRIQDPDILASIMTLHITQGSLEKLSSKVIHHLASSLSDAQLTQYKGCRSPVLALLMLERDDSKDNVALFNNMLSALSAPLNPENLEVLLLLYKLSTKPNIKGFIQQTLALQLHLTPITDETEQARWINHLAQTFPRLHPRAKDALKQYLEEMPLRGEDDLADDPLDTLKAMAIRFRHDPKDASQGLIPLSHFIQREGTRLPYVMIQHLFQTYQALSLRAQPEASAAFCRILSQAELAVQMKIIRSMKEADITSLVQSCLMHITDRDPEQAMPFRKLLTRLTHLCLFENPESLNALKKTIGRARFIFTQRKHAPKDGSSHFTRNLSRKRRRYLSWHMDSTPLNQHSFYGPSNA